MLDNKQSERESMREMYVIKLKAHIEEKQRKLIAETATNVDNQDKSIEDADMNRTGEMSKLSHNQETGRKSKEKEQVPD